MSRRPLSPLQVVRSGMCIGCGSCVAQSESATARVSFDRYGKLRPDGDSNWLQTGNESLNRTCPFSPEAENEDELSAWLYPDAEAHATVGRFSSAYVGYAESGGFRDRGSSGGMVSWMLDELFARGLIDGAAHVVPTEGDRFFRYRISRSREEVCEGAKSRYYPVEMSDVLREIREAPGRYAIVGVPCFIKAIQLLRREDPILGERIVYTLGLFCGHMKSAAFADSFALQMDVPKDEVKAVEYRLKDLTRPASTYTAQLTLQDGSARKRD